MKEVKEEPQKQRDSPWWWAGRADIVWMSVLPNLLYRSRAFPMKTPGSYFPMKTPGGINKLILKFPRRGTWHGAAKPAPKDRGGGLTPPSIETYSKATGIRTGGTGERTDKVNVVQTKHLRSLSTGKRRENEKTRCIWEKMYAKGTPIWRKTVTQNTKVFIQNLLKKSNSDLVRTAQVQAPKLAKERLEGHTWAICN